MNTPRIDTKKRTGRGRGEREQRKGDRQANGAKEHINIPQNTSENHTTCNEFIKDETITKRMEGWQQNRDSDGLLHGGDARCKEGG